MSVQRMSRKGVVRATVFGMQPLWRSTLRHMLEEACVGPVAVCSTVGDLMLVLDEAVGPQLLVADPDGVPGFAEQLRKLTAASSCLTTIVVTERTDLDWVDMLMDAGAVEVMTKHAEVEEIEETLHKAIARRLDWARLTAREVEILGLVAAGGSNRQVAATLWLSDQTVKFHLANVYRKLGVTSRREAVERARAVGLLAPLPVVMDVEPGDDAVAAAAHM
jgi:DNA-binding NarL/FixJ family response regulator